MAAQRHGPVAPDSPLLLAFETATARPGAALLRGAELLGEEFGDPARSASETLLETVDALLAGAGVSLAEVGGFAVSIGPGSFTGLRIGLATVKGLAFGAGPCTAAVSTLEALAHPLEGSRDAVVAALDARRGEVYAAAWSGGPGGAELLAEGVYTPEELAAALPATCTLVGEGADICAVALRGRLGEGVSLASPELALPTARSVGVLGARQLAAGGGVDAAELVPRYLRRAEAEVRRTGIRFQG